MKKDFTDKEPLRHRQIILSVAADLKENLSEKRFGHTERVCKTASELADRYGENIEKAELASLFHEDRKSTRLNSSH